MTTQNIVEKCIHGILPVTCSICKGKPATKDKPPLDHIVNRNQSTESSNVLDNLPAEDLPSTIGSDNSGSLSAAEDSEPDHKDQSNDEKLTTPIPGEDQKNQDEDKKMKKVCLICGGKHKAQDLCDMHYRHWRQGRIDHPVLGPWKLSENGKRIKEGKEKKHIIKPLSENTLLAEARKRIKELGTLADALIIVGDGDQVKKEIGLLAQRYA